ncbi:trypsin-like peptidase domain-containing protein [Ruthenibacterium sp. CLA-JM-H11]|uniref:Trypsin-like peptidase domain-containing protein n=1 Tax=Ruthenibacterium intestinale TaxID=3133163 RepID=A0ABV1GE16_9FIRM
MNNNWEFDYSNRYQNDPNGAPQSGAPMNENNNFGGTQPDPMPGAQPPYTPMGMQPPHKPGNGRGKRIACGVLALVLCGAIGFGGGYVGSMVANNGGKTVIYQAAPADSSDSSSSTGMPTDAASMSVEEIAEKVGPSVVEVTTETVSYSNFFGQYVTSGAGSGVIISEDGYIITNNHVIEGASSIKVRLSDKTEYDATLVGTDSKTDIAVLKIEATGLTPAVIGDSDTLKVGEFALAVGNPLGTLGGTVTDGIISALNRDITVNNQTMSLLQTNAAVNPGNSGGGLFNERGELIGIVNAKSDGSDVEGLGFAIPINTAMEVAESLMTTGYVTGRPAMGVSVLAVTDMQTAMQYGVSQMGVYIVQVNEGGAADKAGLEAGDLLVSIDGNAISTTSDVTSILDEHAVGDTIEVQVVRGKQMVEVSLTLQESQPETQTATSEG